jgi:hypothetical protein
MNSPVKREPQALQEYQRRLNEALADVASNTDAVIALSVGSEGWLVSLSDLSETSICPVIAKTGLMPPGIMGVGNFRGKVNTVISMPQLLGKEVGDLKGNGWATVLHPRFGASLALWWPGMMGLFPRSDFTRHTPTHLPVAARSSWISADARVWHELDTERLLRDRLGLGDIPQEITDGN